jgi:cytochrome c oxidase subunit 2
MENYVWFVADEAGSYNIFCAEYCGVGHADMVTTVEAVTEEEFEAWVQPESEPDDEHPGLALLEKYVCTECHSLDGSPRIGPSLKGVFNRQVTVEKDGQEITLTSDRDYLLRSIREPDVEIVLGFSNVMPTVELSDEEVDAIIDILQKL